MSIFIFLGITIVAAIAGIGFFSERRKQGWKIWSTFAVVTIGNCIWLYFAYNTQISKEIGSEDIEVAYVKFGDKSHHIVMIDGKFYNLNIFIKNQPIPENCKFVKKTKMSNESLGISFPETEKWELIKEEKKQENTEEEKHDDECG